MEKRIESIKAQAKADKASQAELINRIALIIKRDIADDMALAIETAKHFV